MEFVGFTQEDGFLYKKFGKNPYRLGIIIGTHGNETIGFKALEKIDENSLRDVTIVIANQLAIELDKRYVECDLNRCFLNHYMDGKISEKYEFKLSKQLIKLYNKFTYLIDIHSTSFDIEPYLILDNQDKVNKKITLAINNNLVKNAYIIPLFGTVIGSHSQGIGLEIGRDTDPMRITQVRDIILDLLKNLDLNQEYSKNIYAFKRGLNKNEVYKIAYGIQDFEVISKGTLLGFDKMGNGVFAKTNLALLRVNNNLDLGDDIGLVIEQIM